LVIEPDAEIVQSYSGSQSSPQTLKVVGPLSPEAEGVEELVVDAFDYLANAGHPPPQALGPGLLASGALRRMDDVRPVLIEPAPVVLGPLKALVSHVGSPRHRAHTPQPGVRSSSYGEEGLGQRLVGGGGCPETEARDDPGRIDCAEQAKTLLPSQTIGPSDVGISGKPSVSSTLRIPYGHSRTVQRLIRALSHLKKSYQVQEESLDEFRMEAQEAVELGAARQGRKGIREVGLGVAIEIPLAGERRPPGEDGEGDDLALAKGGFRTWLPFRDAGVAKVVDRNVKCGEEGVHVEHKESAPFLSGSGGKLTLIRGHLPLKYLQPVTHTKRLRTDK
jgi:hypothetical protein